MRLRNPALIEQLEAARQRGEFMTTCLEEWAADWVLARDQRANSLDRYVESDGPTLPHELEIKIRKLGVKECLRQRLITPRQLRRLYELSKLIGVAVHRHHLLENS